jgi:hypothetical protein
MGESCNVAADINNLNEVFVGSPKAKRHGDRNRQRRKDKNNIDFTEIEDIRMQTRFILSRMKSNGRRL